MPTFKKNDSVTWSSQSGGFNKQKTGKIEQVIPPNTNVKKYTDELDAPSIPRNHETYLVRVPGKTARSKGKLYWPVASKLMAAPV